MAEGTFTTTKDSAVKAASVIADVTVLANGNTVTVTHARDTLGTRVVVIRDRTTKAVIPAAESGGFLVVFTSATVTTITNQTGNAKPVEISVIVFAN